MIAAALIAGGLTVGPGGRARPSAAAAVTRPSVVFVLTDDLSWNLVTSAYMPHVIALEQQGETFTHYIVADSLCCPSRSSIFTGLFPHDTGVFKNSGPDGGYAAFKNDHGVNLETKTYAVAIQPGGYMTAMMGKYLNGYGTKKPPSYVPPGWSDWHVGADGYPEFNYYLNDNGTIRYFGGPTGGCGRTGSPDNYMVDVLAADATAFITKAGSRPFVMEVATFAPHAPYTPAPRNACDFPGLTEPRDPSFNTNNTNPPSWLGHRKALTHKQVDKIDGQFRMRAQAVEAVDRLIGDVEATLAARRLSNNTYIVFSSDNGYHMGQHRLLPGKMTAFDTDIRVPLIIAGPGVPAGRVVPQVTQNIDLYPTFVQLAGGTPSPGIDGTSLVPLLHPTGGGPPAWRTVALIEHHGPDTTVADPDFENGKLGGNPSTYEAIRISTTHLAGFRGPVEAVYVEYSIVVGPTVMHEYEYYDVAKDPFERHNRARQLTPAQRTTLHTILSRLATCHNATTCWATGVPI